MFFYSRLPPLSLAQLLLLLTLHAFILTYIRTYMCTLEDMKKATHYCLMIGE